MNESEESRIWNSLWAVFQKEWDALPSLGKAMVLADYKIALEEDNCAVHEYARRIGQGNLAEYTKCLHSMGDA